MSMNTSQEDRFWNAKRVMEEILGAEIPAKQMNRIFFEVIEPLHIDTIRAEKKLERITNAWRTLQQELEDE